MTFEAAMEQIDKRAAMGIKPGLARTLALLSCLGDPHKRLKCVHVAGTNGKGSTCTMIASSLKAAGLRVGLSVSPYVLDFRERISINGEWISKSEFARVASEVFAAFDAVEARGLGAPTKFEVLTACTFLYFAQQAVDIAVIEVGLGGRFDASNVIEAPLVSAITAISLDHTDLLGDSVEQIAFEKAGIIKEGCPVAVCALQDAAALCVIKEQAKLRGAELISPDLSSFSPEKEAALQNRFRYKGLDFSLKLLGAHQQQNALLALEVLLLLRGQGYEIGDQALQEGLGSAVIRGRFEYLSSRPPIVLDGGHNRAGIDALCDTLQKHAPNARIITVMGMLADKEYAYCIGQLAKRSCVLIASKPTYDARALAPEEIARIAAENGAKSEIEEDAKAAMRRGLALLREEAGDMLLVCGSLYLLESAYQSLSSD